MNIPNSKKIDAIVIGSGLGGLSSALHLAKKGFNVTVLEKQPKVGGYAQNFHREGYDFDVSLHLLPAMNSEGGLFKLLDYLQVADKLQITEHSPMFTSMFPDNTYRPYGKEQAADYLKSIFPHESTGIDKYINIIKQIVTDNGKLFWDGDIDLRNFFPATYFKKTYQQLLEDCFTDPKIFGLMGQLWQSTGLPNTMCAANWSAEVFGSHILTGNYYIKGGGQALSDAMADTLREAGCTVRTSCLVNKILLKDRKVYGVRLENGEELFSDTIISNANPVQVYFDLIGKEHLAKPFIFKMGTYKPSISLLTLYLGLDSTGKEAGVADHTTFVNHTYDNTVAYNRAINEEFKNTDYIISDYTESDLTNGLKTTHPKDTGIVQILEPANGSAWTDISRDEYRDKKQKVTDTILDKVSKKFPKLKQHIKIMELGTPRTMHLATRNPGGAVYGWAQTPDQADNWRFGGKSHFKGLFFTGAWARGGGGGYMGAVVNGRVTSHQVLLGDSRKNNAVVFDVVKPEKKSSLSLKRYTLITEKKDISPLGELQSDSAIKILSNTSNRFIKDNKQTLVSIWPQFDASKQWTASFFQMRFLFVPFVKITQGDKVSVDTEFKPGKPGKGEFTQTIFNKKTGKKMATATGRVLIRTL